MNSKDTGVVIQKVFKSPKQRKSLLLLDRDGTLNRDRGYTHKLEDLSIIEQNVIHLANLINKQTSIYCISNQSGIGRGFYSREQAFLFNSVLAERLRSFHVFIEKFIMCPHIPEDKCLCRKPKTLMIEIALKETKVSSCNSSFIGNTASDQAASEALNIHYLDVNSKDFERKILRRRNELNVDL